MATSQVSSFCGQIAYFPFTTIPQGWAVCDGAVLKSSDYPTAAALLGDRFGKGGDDTFGLPSLLNAAGTPATFKPCICLDGIKPSSQQTTNPAELAFAFTGQILYAAFTLTPSNFLSADGTAVSVARFKELDMLIGNAFGGTAPSTFGLPDLVTDPTTPVGITPLISSNGLYPSTGASGETLYPAFTGQIIYTSYSQVPVGWQVCNGALVKTTDYTDLFALLDTRYGGDGQTTFGLPNLVGSASTPTGMTPLILMTGGVYPLPA